MSGGEFIRSGVLGQRAMVRLFGDGQRHRLNPVCR
jgi:hypothetical protein